MKKIKAIRKKLGLTQKELARIMGRSERTIIRWEMGYSAPCHAEMEKIKGLK